MLSKIEHFTKQSVQIVVYNSLIYNNGLKLCVAPPWAHRFNFSMASHKSKLRAVLFIELMTSAVSSLHQRTLIVQVQPC